MRIRSLLTLLVLLPALALAQEPPKAEPPKTDDPIAAELLKDKEAYVAAVEKAKQDMLKTFDKLYEMVKNNKFLKIDVQLAQLEKIEAEKKAFDENGVPPTLTGMKVPLSEYRTAQKRAEVACKLAFEKAAKAYRDKGDIKIAAAALDEMKEFLAKTPTAAAVGAGAVVLVSGHSGKVLGLSRGDTDEGTRVLTADYVRGDQTQLWKVVPAADGWVYVENVKAGLVMTVRGRNNGAELQIAKKKEGDEGQLWKLDPLANHKGLVRFLSKLDTDKALAITQASRAAGIRILLWDHNNNTTTVHGYALTPPR
jgi:hypothetical protein